MSNIIDEIKAVYAEDEASGVLPRTLTDVPHSYERITPEWLSLIVCKDVPGAEVTMVTLGEASHGSSNRQRIFVEYNQAGQEAGLPPSVFCKGSMVLANRVLLGMSLTARGEAAFFNKIRPRTSLLVPNALHAAFDERTHGYIVVMEDMTDTAQFCDETTAVDRARAEDMVRELANLHSAFYESAEFDTPTIPYMHWSDWWQNMMAVSPDFGEKCDIAFGDTENIIPARLFKRRSEIWPLTMESAERHRGLPRSLIHCDVHLKNWFSLNGKMGLCDWQIANVGHWSRDFIYAMSTALTVENRRAWLDDLLRLYLDEMAERGVPKIGLDEALTYCRQQLMSTLAFWTITLRPAKDMPPMQPDSTTLCFIERIAAAMDDLDALDSFRTAVPA
jgi:thiamine kinase-like enzyme